MRMWICLTGFCFDRGEDGVHAVCNRSRPGHLAGVVGQTAQPQAASSRDEIGDGTQLGAGVGVLRGGDDQQLDHVWYLDRLPSTCRGS